VIKIVALLLMYYVASWYLYYIGVRSLIY
jgi:hypothetical protein